LTARATQIDIDASGYRQVGRADVQKLAYRPCSHGHFVRIRLPRRPFGCYFCNVIDAAPGGRHVDRVVGIRFPSANYSCVSGLQRFDMF